jgi:IS4 transposase
MMLGQIFERFIQGSPISVMARALLEHALHPDDLNELFYDTKVKQYTRELLFSALVDLMGLVVCNVRPKVSTAYQALLDQIGVSLSAVYEKLKGIEPPVCRELVRHTARQLKPVIDQLGGTLPDLLPGYRVKILDGSHLAKTQKRIGELRTTRAGALPGQSLVVLDPQTMLVVDVIPCEDGHAQERSLIPQVLPDVTTGELWIEDRNFCTTGFVFGVADRGGCFLVRQHKSTLHIEALTALVDRGRVSTGAVQEQTLRLSKIADDGSRRTMEVRRIRLALDKPTRKKELEVALLTNLPAEAATALVVADLYLNRWTVERVFQTLAEALQSEIDTLGYPRAALFGFCVGLAAYNVLAAVRAALRSVHGTETVESEVSTYYIADEVRATYRGMMIAIPVEEWGIFGRLSVPELAEVLRELAGKVHLPAFRRHPRGPKKPRPARTSGKSIKHVSTAKLLAQRKTTKVKL